MDATSKEPLWPKGAPGALGDAPKDCPQLIRYSPAKDRSVGTAVVIFPGGGYGGLAMEHEGVDVAAWLNEQGVHAFICDYRHRGKGYGHPAPRQDAQRAVRMVRSKTNKLCIAADRIGVLGFSAGGHLASTVATHFDTDDGLVTDALDRFSSRPDFAILCYPVIAFGETYSHKGSQRNLIGKRGSDELIERYSNQKRVTEQTPPTFLWHTAEDSSVPSMNSLVYFQSLQAANVSAELHIYAKGKHGMGLATGKPGAENWPSACLAWLKSEALLDDAR